MSDTTRAVNYKNSYMLEMLDLGSRMIALYSLICSKNKSAYAKSKFSHDATQIIK